MLVAIKEATIADLARHLGVSRRRVYALLEDRRLSEQTACEMANFFGVEVDYLIDPKPLTLADLRSAP